MKKNTLIELIVFAFGLNKLFSQERFKGKFYNLFNFPLQEPANKSSNSSLNLDDDTSVIRLEIYYIAIPSMNVEPLKFIKQIEITCFH